MIETTRTREVSCDQIDISFLQKKPTKMPLRLLRTSQFVTLVKKSITFNCRRSRQKVFIYHVLAIDMKRSFLVVLSVLGVITSLFTYSFTFALSGSPLFLNDALAQQGVGLPNSESQEGGPEGRQGPDVGVSSGQCPPNQHHVGSANECEWDNCGAATPPMYRNTQTGRCVSDCSEVGQFWVRQGNICVLGEVTNATSTPIPPPPSNSVPNRGEGNGNGTIQTEDNSDLTSDNATTSTLTSNVTSTPPSTITQTITSLAGEPALPYACLSNTFTCYCDGTEDCIQLTSSGECKAEVRTVEGKPGLGECDWNTKS